MATYSTDLQTITLCDSGTFTEFTGYTSGAAPALSTENYIHNGSAVDQATGQATGQTVSIAFDYGSNITWTSGWVVIGWAKFDAPTSIQTWSTGGIRIGVGSALGNVSLYNALGSDFGDYPYGGWQCTAIDPQLTADQTVGSGSGGNYRYFGTVSYLTQKITKGSPNVIDAFRYGRGQIKAIGTSATFAGLASTNDATTARWGLFTDRGGVYRWKGLLSLGDTSNTVTFSDSNKSILIEDTPRVSSTFNKIEVVNSGSSVTWTSISISGVQTSITGSAPTSPGDFAMIDNATVTKSSCTFTDMGTFAYLSGLNSTGTTWRRCKQISVGTGNAPTMTTSLITGSTVAANTSALLWNCTQSPNGKLDGSTFVKGTNAHHAIEFGTNSPTSMTLTNINFSGFNASNGQNDSALHIKRTSGTVTIYIVGGNTPSYKTDGATIDLQSNPVDVTATVKTDTGTAISGAMVLVKATAGGNLPVDVTVTITNSGTTATVSHTSHGMATNDKVMIKGASLQANNGVFTITYISDNSYSYTMSSTPGSSPTGTIKATYVALSGTTDSNGEITMSRVFSASQPVNGWARKSTSAPFYKPGPISGTISTSADTNFSAVLILDQ